MGRKKKITKGRQKIEIERIASDEARHVCFSKRRTGLYTKASDLATLCGAEVAVVVHSPAGNPYSFGSPGVKQVADRFLSGSLAPSGSSSLHLQGHRMNVVHQELNQRCMELSRRIEAANARKSMLEERLKALVQTNQVCQLADEMEGLGLTELERVKESLDRLKGRTEGRIGELLRGGGASSSSAIMAANPIRMAHQFALGAGQVRLANLGYGRGFY